MAEAREFSSKKSSNKDIIKNLPFIILLDILRETFESIIYIMICMIM